MVNCPAPLQRAVSVETVDGTLVVRAVGNVGLSSDCSVTIPADTFSSLEFDGPGSASLTGATTGAFTLARRGAGAMDVAGLEAPHLVIEKPGTGAGTMRGIATTTTRQALAGAALLSTARTTGRSTCI